MPIPLSGLHQLRFRVRARYVSQTVNERHAAPELATLSPDEGNVGFICAVIHDQGVILLSCPYNNPFAWALLCSTIPGKHSKHQNRKKNQ
jgi:hypothetical protein